MSNFMLLLKFLLKNKEFLLLIYLLYFYLKKFTENNNKIWILLFLKDTKSKIKDYNQCNLKYFNSEKNTQKANDDDIKIYLINLKNIIIFFAFFNF